MTAFPAVDVDGNAVLLRAARIGLEALDRCIACRSGLACSLHWPEGEPAAPADKPAKELAYQRYARAYAEGQESASGRPFAPLTDSSAQLSYRKMATTYAPALTGDSLISWFWTTSSLYRHANPDPTYEAGYHPRRCLAWLNAGKPLQKGAAPTRQTRGAAGRTWKTSEERGR